MAKISNHNSFREFRSLASRNPPATNNLYGVTFRTPPAVMKELFADYFTANANTASLDGSKLLTFYATDITIPSRQITTGDAKVIGSMYRYPTGTTFSEISMQFILPRNLQTRTLFERWMNYISSDSQSTVAFYDDCVCPFVDIIKYERGSGSVEPTNYSELYGKKPNTTINGATGAWVLKNAFPFNISNITLTSGSANLLTMEVSFYFERYRFFVPSGSSEGLTQEFKTLSDERNIFRERFTNRLANTPTANAQTPPTSSTATTSTTGTGTSLNNTNRSTGDRNSR